MRTKSCKRCGRTFTPASKYTYLCPDCHGDAKASGVVRERICRTCGTPFPGGPRAWYCPDCRAERKRSQQRRQARLGAARPIGSTDRCIRCGGEYTVVSGMQKYCPDCAPVAVNDTVKERKRKYAADRKDQMAAYKQIMSSNRHVCVICGTVYDSNLATASCSDACDKIRRQQAQKRAEGKRKQRRENND